VNFSISFFSLKALDTRCHFVMGGWQDSEPFICNVSNFAVPDDPPDLILSDVRHHIPRFSEAAVATPRFQDWIQRFKNMTDRAAMSYFRNGDRDLPNSAST
jgi:hypothetical protein